MLSVKGGFSFINRIEEIEENIRSGRWQSALALSLTLPDICGALSHPEIVKKYKNGKLIRDKSGNEVRDIGKQYIMWFDTYASDFFYNNKNDKEPYLDGEKCWQLRCEYLHQNKGFNNEDIDSGDVLFHLGLNCGKSICVFNNVSKDDGIWLDIKSLCERLCTAARSYYDKYENKEEFDVFNTPVIDWVEYNNEEQLSYKKKILIAGIDKETAGAIKIILEDTAEIIIAEDIKKAKRIQLKEKISGIISDYRYSESNWIKAIIKDNKISVFILSEEKNSDDGFTAISFDDGYSDPNKLRKIIGSKI